jgi:hypothetical protein
MPRRLPTRGPRLTVRQEAALMRGGVSVSQPGAATRRFALRRGSVCATAASMQASAPFEASPLMVWQASRWTAGVKAASSVRLPGRYIESGFLAVSIISHSHLPSQPWPLPGAPRRKRDERTRRPVVAAVTSPWLAAAGHRRMHARRPSTLRHLLHRLLRHRRTNSRKPRRASSSTLTRRCPACHPTY